MSIAIKPLASTPAPYADAFEESLTTLQLRVEALLKVRMARKNLKDARDIADENILRARKALDAAQAAADALGAYNHLPASALAAVVQS